MTETPTTPPPTFEEKGHLWLTIPEAARRLGVTTGRLYHLTAARRVLTHPKPPYGLTYVRADSLEAYRQYREQLTQVRATGRALGLARP